jgi:hypothetical protein
LPRPVPLLEVNSLLRLYKQEGHYYKLALMNQYDTEKYVGVLDLFLGQEEQFFKMLYENEYILFLNDQITRGRGDPVDLSSSVFHIDFMKRQRESTASEMGSLLPINLIETVVQLRNSVYKCLFLFKNNISLLVRILETDNEPEMLTIKI